MQHHRAFYSRKEPNLLLDFYSFKAKKKPCNHWNYRVFDGASDVTRTHDLLITNQLLYRLSYISIFTFGVADLILTNQLLYQLSYTSIGNGEII